MSNVPRISDAEWEIMKVCWSKAPLTAQEIIEALSVADEWHPKTVKTLLNRLVKKRALGFEKQGRTYLYEPLVTEQDCVAAESHSFLERVFRGALHPMLAHFVRTKNLSETEIAELKRLLKQKEGK